MKVGGAAEAVGSLITFSSLDVAGSDLGGGGGGWAAAASSENRPRRALGGTLGVFERAGVDRVRVIWCSDAAGSGSSVMNESEWEAERALPVAFGGGPANKFSADTRGLYLLSVHWLGYHCQASMIATVTVSQ